MHRVIKERVEREFHSLLDLIEKNNIVIVDNISTDNITCTLGKYRIFIGKIVGSDYHMTGRKEYHNDIYYDDDVICSLEILKGYYFRVTYFCGNYHYEIFHRPNENTLSFSKDALNGEGDVIKIYINNGKIYHVVKELSDIGKKMYVRYGYLRNGHLYIILNDSMDEILDDAFQDDYCSERSVEETLRYLLEHGIFGYFDKDGKMNLLTFYMNRNGGEFNLFSKTNPGEPLTEEEQQYLIEEVEKLRRDPFNHFIDW